MNERYLDMEAVTVEFDAETLDAIDDIAFADHRENREAAIRTLLDEWVKEHAADAADDESVEDR